MPIDAAPYNDEQLFPGHGFDARADRLGELTVYFDNLALEDIERPAESPGSPV